MLAWPRPAGRRGTRVGTQPAPHVLFHLGSLPGPLPSKILAAGMKGRGRERRLSGCPLGWTGELRGGTVRLLDQTGRTTIPTAPRARGGIQYGFPPGDRSGDQSMRSTSLRPANRKPKGSDTKSWSRLSKVTLPFERRFFCHKSHNLWLFPNEKKKHDYFLLK